jgi:glycosyltransferase involved in cell wall biosynthesis
MAPLFAMIRSVMPPSKLAVITSHPIQYYAPVFRALAESGAVDLRVFYTWSQAAQTGQYDAGFGAAVSWDVPLLSGYAYEFVPNAAAEPGPAHFNGLVNPTLARDIEAWHADAVLVFGWSYRSHLLAMRRFKGRIPVLFRGDSTLLDPQSWWRTALRRACLRWVYRHVDVAIAVGSNSRDYFAWCGIPASRIAMAPHSIDTERFGADAASQESRAGAWRADLGIDPGSVVFLFAGKLQYKKDPALLLEAFCALPPGSHLIYAGSGELEAELKARARGLDAVHFLPFQNQSAMPTVYRLGDVLVLPSRGPGETWGLALNEAMACARPHHGRPERLDLHRGRPECTRRESQGCARRRPRRSSDHGQSRSRAQRRVFDGRDRARHFGRGPRRAYARHTDVIPPRVP